MSAAPTRRVMLGTDVALVLAGFCLLIPALFTLAGADESAKRLMVGAYIGLISGVGGVLLAARASVERWIVLLALFALPYILAVLARGGGVTDAVYMITILMTVTVGAHIRNQRQFLTGVSLLALAWVAVSFAQLLVSDERVHFAGLTNHKNNLGTLMFFCFVGLAWALRQRVGTFDRLIYIYGMIACLAVAYATSSRASMLTMLVFAGFYLTAPIWTATRRRYFLLLAAVFGASVLVVPAYVYLSYSPYAGQINEISLALTGHRFFTGRNLVWPAYLLLISQSPLFGHGFNTESLAILRLGAGLSENYVGLSAHNLYIMVLTQTGLIGLGSFLVFMVGVWHLLWPAATRAGGAVVVALVPSFLIHEVFEVSLIQNNMLNVWLLWLLVGLGLGLRRGRAG